MNFREGITNNKTILTNMASLSILQAANYIIPIIVIPFVVRALGAEAFGKASYAQNIIAYLTIIVNFGFEYSATQDIAINKENHSSLVSIFWTVIKSKAYLLALTFIILGLLYFTFPKVHDDFLLFFFAALVNVGFCLFPTWFFQGMENMTKMALFNFSIRVISGTLVIFLITAPEQYRYYLLISSLAYIVIGIIAFFYVINHYDLMPNDNIAFNKSIVKKGFPIFINNLFATIYSISGLTVLGLFASDYQVGIYSGAYKLIVAINMLISMPITIALFPQISIKFNESKEQGFSFLKKCILITTIPALVICLCVLFISPWIVKLFLGGDFLESIKVLQILSFIPFLVITASFFTVQGLYGLQLQKFAPIVGALVAVVGIILNIVLIKSYGAIGAAYAYILAEIAEIILSASFVLIHKNKRNRP